MSSPEKPVPGRLRRAPLLVAIFLLFCGGTARLVRAWIPMPSHYDLDEKLRYFTEHKDEFDLLFVGSSATFRNYVPEVVDAELAAEGLEVTSFNFGVVGFRSFETDFMVKWILAQKPARLRWMVIEPPTFEPPFEYEAIQGDKTELAVHSHTPEETYLILRSVWLSEAPLGLRLRETIRHLKLLGLNLGNIGRAPATVLQRLNYEPDWDPPAWLTEGRGFQSTEDRPGFAEPDPKNDPLSDPEAYRRKLISLDRANRSPVPLDTYNLTALRRQVEVVRAAGVEPIYCSSPILFSAPEVLALDERGELPNLLAFHLPKAYPKLFAVEKRIDNAHLRGAGAVEFSRFLAPRLAEIMKAAGP
jgi:hypothetical protein